MEVCITLISHDFPRAFQVMYAILCAILSLVTLFSNILLIYTLHETGQLKTISNKLILILSISDLGLGIFAFPAQVIVFSVEAWRSCLIEQIIAFPTVLLAYFSFLIMSCISIDRYLQVTKMQQYNLYMNNCRMKVLVIVSFALASAISAVSTFAHSTGFQITLICVGIFVMVFSAIVYMFLIKKLQNHVNSVNKSIKPSQLSEKKSEGTQDVTEMVNDSNPMDQTGINLSDKQIEQTGVSTTNDRIDQTGMSQSDKQIDQARKNKSKDSANRLSATKTIQVLILFTFVTYMPYHILSIPWTYHKSEKMSELALNVFYSLSCVVAMCNASGNACIIIYGNKRSRQFVVSLFRRKRMTASS